MKSFRLSKKYAKTLENYLKWRVDNFLRVPMPFAMDGPSAAEAMFNWETHGKPPTHSSEPDLLADYMQGKKSRDWHITEWKSGVKMGYFEPKEFLGCLGLEDKDWKRVFGND